jgi:hypothetical protein
VVVGDARYDADVDSEEEEMGPRREKRNRTEAEANRV